MSILGDIASVATKFVAPGLGDVLGGGLGDKLGGLAGGLLGGIGNSPLGALGGKANPLGDLWGAGDSVLRAVRGAVDDLTFHGQDIAKGGCKPPPPPPSDGCGKPGNTGGTSSGGSIFEKIFAILQKLQDQLNKKVGDLDGLDPNKDKAALDKGLFEVQQLQQQMTQLTSMATNLSSADHNSKKGIVDNFNIR